VNLAAADVASHRIHAVTYELWIFWANGNATI
jgi:hypothetical protein